MPLTDIIFDVNEIDTGRGGASMAGIGYAQNPLQLQNSPASAHALEIQISTDCFPLPGVLPDEANAPGSNYPGEHWARWDGVINLATGAPLLGVDDGILENCLANYAPILYDNGGGGSRLCIYLAGDGKYYIAGPEDGDARSIPTLRNLTIDYEFAINYDDCP
jgi:hypothetical protein